MNRWAWVNGRHLLMLVGTALVIFSMAVFAATGALATVGYAVLGVGAMTFGVALPRLKKGEVSPKKLAFELWQEESLAIAERSEVPIESLDEPTEFVVASRAYLAGEALAAVLRPKPGELLEACHLRLYLYDEDVDRLRPVHLPDEGEDENRSAEEWAPGAGATGTAWQRGEYVLAVGEEVWDTTYGVTAEQAERFRDLTAVASIPVTNAAGEVIGVITATTTEPDGGALVHDWAFSDLLAVAILVARALVDLLGWFPDRYDQPRGELPQ